jgi:hypothetical protein
MSSSSSSSRSSRNDPLRPFFRTRYESERNTSETSASAPIDDEKPSRDSVQPVGLDLDTCYALYLSLQADVEQEVFVNNMQQDITPTTSDNGDINKNQDGSEISMALNHVSNDKHGDMLDDHDYSLALKPQADLGREVSLQEARLQAEISVVATSTGKAWNSEIMALDHVNDNQEQGGSTLDDHALALNLHADLNGEVSLQEARLQAERNMLATSVGKAWKFVE